VERCRALDMTLVIPRPCPEGEVLKIEEHHHHEIAEQSGGHRREQEGEPEPNRQRRVTVAGGIGLLGRTPARGEPVLDQRLRDTDPVVTWTGSAVTTPHLGPAPGRAALHSSAAPFPWSRAPAGTVAAEAPIGGRRAGTRSNGGLALARARLPSRSIRVLT